MKCCAYLFNDLGIKFPKPPAPPKEEHFSYSAPFSYTSTYKYSAAANILQLHRASSHRSGNTNTDVVGGVGLMGATSALARVGHHVRVPKNLRKIEVASSRTKLKNISRTFYR